MSERIAGSMKSIWLREGDSLILPAATFEFDSNKLKSWLGFVGRGLTAYHWGVKLTESDSVVPELFSNTHGNWLAKCFGQMNAKSRIECDLGNGTINYQGLQASDPPSMTIWMIRMFGGLTLVGDESTTKPNWSTCSAWWIFTGPPEVRAILASIDAHV
ncbi:MAG: hypothetical protein KIT83_15465 [Bryobacterales bacterium]|nr:hypothetical protein [Bryobacterales bacterium]